MRIVENWLTSVGEIGYQTPFAQLLACEGFHVLHGPVHHPMEHGKDIVARASDGSLHAFQLKGGKISLPELEKLQGQLFALAGTAVSYPGIEPPRRPDRAYLVTNGVLTTPVRDRLRSFNDANRVNSFPSVEAIEREQLVGRLVDALAGILPVEPELFNRLLQLVLGDGTGPFPVKLYCQLLDSIRPSEQPMSASDGVRRFLTSMALLTAFLTGPWEMAENHLSVAEAWIVASAMSLYLADTFALGPDEWTSSFELCQESARAALYKLLNEAYAAEDLVVPSLVEGLIYPLRATLVCGYCSALLLSEDVREGDQDIVDKARQLLLREYRYLRIIGEAQCPHLFVTACALEQLGESAAAVELIGRWAAALSVANQPDSKVALADPYHSHEEVLMHNMGGQTEIRSESFDGQVYTLHVALDWLARRGQRHIVAAIWPKITHLQFCEFQTSCPARMLLHTDPDGQHKTWLPPMTASWSEMRGVASAESALSLPQQVKRSFLPFLPLIFPHRFTRSIGRAIDTVEPVAKSDASLAE